MRVHPFVIQKLFWCEEQIERHALLVAGWIISDKTNKIRLWLLRPLWLLVAVIFAFFFLQFFLLLLSWVLSVVFWFPESDFCNGWTHFQLSSHAFPLSVSGVDWCVQGQDKLISFFFNVLSQSVGASFSPFKRTSPLVILRIEGQNVTMVGVFNPYYIPMLMISVRLIWWHLHLLMMTPHLKRTIDNILGAAWQIMFK